MNKLKWCPYISDDNWFCEEPVDHDGDHGAFIESSWLREDPIHWTSEEGRKMDTEELMKLGYFEVAE